jgi:hypothetical protein
MPTHEVRCDPVSSHDHLDVVSNLQSITASGFRAATSRTAAALKTRRYPSIRRRLNMTQVYFHCSNAKKVFVEHRGALVDDLVEARDHATRVVQSFTSERSLEDWHDWVMHVSDDRGDELFVVPFIFVLGEPH